MQEPAAWNSCCQVGIENGVAQCVGPIVDCGDEDFSTEQQDRWALLNRGPGEITQEVYWNGEIDSPDPVPGEIGAAWVVQNALNLLLNPTGNAFGVSQVNAPVVPEQCIEQTEPCDEGTCTDPDTGETSCDTSTNPDCLGLCQGPDVGEPAPPCTLNEPLDPEVCDPESFPRAFYWSFNPGTTTEPTPSLTDGIAYQLGFTATMDNPNGQFGVTPDGQVEFAVHYYEPAGPPESAEAVVNGSCVALQKLIDEDNQPGGDTQPMPDAGGADAGADMGTGNGGELEPGEIYAGSTYIAQQALSEGCNRYFFSFIDGDGFVQRYPSLGSLGVRVGVDGNIVYNDPGCPQWAPEVPASSCLPAADECNDGDTRPCYTGRDGTQDKGICGIGTEACESGRWTGLCEGEVRPEAEDTCQDGIDNDCNGEVDDGCPIIVDPGNNGNNSNNQNNANNENNGTNNGTNGGTNGTNGGDGGDDGDGGSSDDGGCAVTQADTQTPAALLVALLGLMGWRMRRR